MPGLIQRNDIDEVRSRTRIDEIVGDYVSLKSAGVGSMKGLCPFHEERSPSFHVRPLLGYYHCFGCGEGGDVYSFLQKMDHVSFQEAVERLAGRLGYELHYEDGSGPAVDHTNRARILAANKAAEEFYIAKLSSPEAEPGRRFLGERGFDAVAAQRFGIGFAPRGGALAAHLKTVGFSEEEGVTAGLLGRGERGDVYDRFRGRLIWPIRDTTGQTLGFGARRLLDDDKGPKYLNTPETPVYHKSQVLYGIDLAKRDIAKGRQVVVVEGYTDVMACHLAGVTTAVATCGTAFGADHVKVVRRLIGDVDNADTTGTGEVVFTFDPDEAGQRAASKAFGQEHQFAAQTFVAVAPDGLDPCDLRLHRGDDAVRRLISTRKPMFEFMVRRVLDAHDLETVEGRVAAMRAAAPVVAGIRDRALSIGYVRSLAGWLGMEPNEVGRAVQAASATTQKGDDRQRRAPAQRTTDLPQDAPQSGHYDESHPPPPDDDHGAEPSLMRLATDVQTRTERDVLMALLQYPGHISKDLLGRTLAVDFSDHSLAVVRDAIAVNIEHADAADWVARIVAEVPPRYAGLVGQLAVAPIPEREDRIAAYCTRIVSDVVDRSLLRRKADLMGSLRRVDVAVDPVRFAELQREISQLEIERRSLRED